MECRGYSIRGSSEFQQRVSELLERSSIAATHFEVTIAACDVRSADAAALIADASGANRDAARVIVCSPRAGPKAIRRAIDAGADGIVWSELMDTLPRVVRTVTDGYLCLPRELKRRVAEPRLTRREKQVLGQVVLGLSNREIATTLGIGETTVKSHLRNALSKLGAESRVEAARMILDPNVGLGLGVLSIVGARD
jgi:DNA-binding NarL/FixJ family response regulator